MPSYSTRMSCWNCDGESTAPLIVPLETASGGQFELALCQECFDSFFAPLITGSSPRRRPDQASPTVLVVDDDPGIRRLLRLAFEGEGFNVDIAANGQEALARVGDESPQAIVLDLRMPVMSGEDFLSALRRSSRAHSIPVLVISAYGVGTSATSLGVNAFLAKPLQLHTLIRTVSNLIANPA
jgi:CheY-like chemotaxis protein